MIGLTSKMRHRISIEESLQVADGAGGYSTSWSEVAEIFASVKPYGSSAREKIEHQSVRTKARLRFIIRYRTDVDHSMRVLFDGVYYDIKAVVDPDMRKVTLELMVEENVA